MKLIFNNTFSILGPKWFRYTFFGILRVHWSNNFFPLLDGVDKGSVGLVWGFLIIGEDHDAALSTSHVFSNLIKVWFSLMLVVKVCDLLFKEFSLEHVTYRQSWPRLFNWSNHLGKFFRFKHYIRLYYCNRKGNIYLLRVEKLLIAHLDSRLKEVI